jgi:glutathione S-transferase
VPLKLVIGNKAYSSWSMRPWLLMRVFEIAFDEVVIPLRTATTAEAIRRHSPAGKVPILLDSELVIWDSLAIIDHLAELRPDLAIWPSDRVARATARSLAAEMHAGFSPLRRALPMNMRRAPKPCSLEPATQAEVADNVARIEDAWTDARQRFGGGGMFLFGPFSAVDAMFAPVVNRFESYAVEVRDTTRAYMDAIQALPAWRDWRAGADAEGWHIEAIDAL